MRDGGAEADEDDDNENEDDAEVMMDGKEKR